MRAGAEACSRPAVNATGEMSDDDQGRYRRATVLTGPWPDAVVPEISLLEFLLAAATQQAERAAIIDASSGRTLHYAELADGVRRVRSRRPRPGQHGELWVRTPALMTGYLGNPAASAAHRRRRRLAAYLRHRPFDTDGNLFLLDRAKEVIKVKGFQVAPAELEAVLRSHPAVADAAVIPVPDERADERAGELPKAYVAPAQQVTPQELIDYVAARVAPYKRIHQVSFADAIPTSPSGKTLRRLLTVGEKRRS